VLGMDLKDVPKGVFLVVSVLNVVLHRAITGGYEGPDSYEQKGGLKVLSRLFGPQPSMAGIPWF